MADPITIQTEELFYLDKIYSDQLQNVEISPFTRGYTGEFFAKIHLPAEILIYNPVNGIKNMNVLNLNHLPPISLSFSLSANYPCEYSDLTDLPQLMLNCVWLTSRHCNQIVEILTDICFQNPGERILHKIFKYLEDDYILTLLDWHETFLLNTSTLYYELSSDDVNSKLRLLSDYNALKLQEILEGSNQHCSVCDEDVLGVNCTSLETCKHVFCNECILLAITNFLNESQFSSRFTCLECNEPFTISALKKALPTEVFEKYEKLILTRTFKMMDDVATCPNTSCGNFVLIDPIYLKGFCSNCNSSFCPKCAKPYHGLGLCEDEEDQKPDPKEMPEKDLLLRTYQNSSSQKYRDFLNKNFGLEKIEREDNEQKTNEQIKRTRKCPKCTIPVEKISGCNHMVCSICRQDFCWGCMKIYRAKSEHICDTFYVD